MVAVARAAVAAEDPERFRSGYSKIDDGVRPALECFCRVFRLDGDWLPDFSFYDDGDVPNSRADGPGPFPGLRRPHIWIGRGAVAEAVRVSNGNFGAALTGVLAHEFAHLRQMRSGVDRDLRNLDDLGALRLVELHADFLAGWALPQAWWITKIGDLGVAAQQFFALGDVDLNSHVHHGTSLQRQTIMAAGYTWGLISPGEPDTAVTRGQDVLKDLFPHWFRTK